jgi:hypothetical protein
VNSLEYVGYSSTLSGTFTAFTNYLYLLRLPPLAHDATLEGFGVIGAASGANAKLVLYADNGSGTAPSGAYLGGTGNQVVLIAGTKEQGSDMTPMLSAGATYWLGITVSADIALSAQADSNQVGQRVSFGYSAAWPTGPTGPAIAPASDLAIYIKVIDLN